MSFISGDKTYSFNIAHEKYCLKKYAYCLRDNEMYPKEKEQVIELINDIISIMLSGNVSNKYFGKAVYSGWSGSVEIIEPMLDLRIALSEAVSEIYGVDKYAFFDKLLNPGNNSR